MSKDIETRRPAGAVGTQAPRTILLDDVKLLFPNFSGEAGRFNAPGKRNFNVLLPMEAALDMERTGYNIKWREPQEEGQEREPRVKVNVNFLSRNPPEIFLVNSLGKRKLDANTCGMIDYLTFDRVDVIFSRYERRQDDGSTTVTAYLQTMYAFLREDELRQRYADIPDIDAADEVDEGAMDVLVWQETSDDEINAEKMRALEA